MEKKSGPMVKNAERENEGSGSGATRGQARLIIALLTVLIALMAVVGVWVFLGSDDSSAAADTRTDNSEVKTPTVEEAPEMVVDSVALLEAADVDSVNPPPAPEPVESWGDYVQNRTWSGSLRVVVDAPAVPIANEDGGSFPASMNGCGTMMYSLTFRSVDESVSLDAQLLNAANEVSESALMTEGWTFSTNCQTPQFAIASSSEVVSVTDVVYDIAEYRRASVTPQVAEVEQPIPEAPYVVECLFGTPGPARWSDGTIQNSEECANTPEAQHSRRAESVCGGLYGWQEVSREEYESLCGTGNYPG